MITLKMRTTAGFLKYVGNHVTLLSFVFRIMAWYVLFGLKLFWNRNILCPFSLVCTIYNIQFWNGQANHLPKRRQHYSSSAPTTRFTTISWTTLSIFSQNRKNCNIWIMEHTIITFPSNKQTHRRTPFVTTSETYACAIDKDADWLMTKRKDCWFKLKHLSLQ